MSFTVEDVLHWDSISVIDSMIKTGLAKTKSEARRLIDQGAIKVDDIKVTNHKAFIAFSPDRQKHVLLQVDMPS